MKKTCLYFVPGIGKAIYIWNDHSPNFFNLPTFDGSVCIGGHLALPRLDTNASVF